MEDLMSQLKSKYDDSTAAPADDVDTSGAWKTDWKLCPPNVVRKKHDEAAAWVATNQPAWSPIDFYEKYIADKGGALPSDWLRHPGGPKDPRTVQPSPSFGGLGSAPATAAVNPPPAAVEEAATASEAAFTPDELRVLQRLARFILSNT